MKKISFYFVVLAALAGAFFLETPQAEASARYGGGYGYGYVGGPGYGAYYGGGYHGIPGGYRVRAAWYGPVGRYPKFYFPAPWRRGLGLPGFTPIQQLMYGRGAVRRFNRRAFLFGRGFY